MSRAMPHVLHCSRYSVYDARNVPNCATPLPTPTEVLIYCFLWNKRAAAHRETISGCGRIPFSCQGFLLWLQSSLSRLVEPSDDFLVILRWYIGALLDFVSHQKYNVETFWGIIGSRRELPLDPCKVVCNISLSPICSRNLGVWIGHSQDSKSMESRNKRWWASIQP